MVLAARYVRRVVWVDTSVLHAPTWEALWAIYSLFSDAESSYLSILILQQPMTLRLRKAGMRLQHAVLPRKNKMRRIDGARKRLRACVTGISWRDR